jgi:hypothetical protein
MVCQYYSKAALVFLENKRRWVMLLRVLLIAGLFITIFGALILIMNGILSDPGISLCRRPLFLILRSGGEIIIFFFLSFGIVLTRKINHMQRDTQFEKGKQKRA